MPGTLGEQFVSHLSRTEKWVKPVDSHAWAFWDQPSFVVVCQICEQPPKGSLAKVIITTVVFKIIMTTYPCSLQHYSQLRGKQPKWPATDDDVSQQNAVHPHNGIFISLRREGNSDTHCNTDGAQGGLWGHYTKWNKPDSKQQILQVHLYAVSKVATFIGTESTMVVAGAGGRRKGSWQVRSFSFTRWKVLEAYQRCEGS